MPIYLPDQLPSALLPALAIFRHQVDERTLGMMSARASIRRAIKVTKVPTVRPSLRRIGKPTVSYVLIRLIAAPVGGDE